MPQPKIMGVYSLADISSH